MKTKMEHIKCKARVFNDLGNNILIYCLIIVFVIGVVGQNPLKAQNQTVVIGSNTVSPIMKIGTEVRDGKICNVYEVVTKDQNLRTISEFSKLDLEILRKYNRQLRHFNKLSIGTKIFYPRREMMVANPQVELTVDNPQMEGADNPEIVTEVTDPQIIQPTDRNFEKFYTDKQTIRFKGVDGNVVTKRMNVNEFKLDYNQPIAFIDNDQYFIIEEQLPDNLILMPGVILAEASTGHESIPFKIAFIEDEAGSFKIDDNRDNWHGHMVIVTIPIGMEDGKEYFLKNPVKIKVTTEGNTEGSYFEITKIPDGTEAPLSLDNKYFKPNDFVKVTVRIEDSLTTYNTDIPVVPYIDISSSKRVIQGFGIQTTPLHISLKGVKKYDPFDVVVKTSNGFLDSDIVTLSPGSIQKVNLRSENVGKAVVTIDNDYFTPNSVTVYFSFPWLFIMFSIIGGIIGTLIRLFSGSNKGFNIKSFIAGILIGFVVAVAFWALGIQLFEFHVEVDFLTGFGVLGVSALGGYAGGFKFVRKVAANTD